MIESKIRADGGEDQIVLGGEVIGDDALAHARTLRDLPTDVPWKPSSTTASIAQSTSCSRRLRCVKVADPATSTPS